jgi:hypothetical protein
MNKTNGLSQSLLGYLGASQPCCCWESFGSDAASNQPCRRIRDSTIDFFVRAAT